MIVQIFVKLLILIAYAPMVDGHVGRTSFKKPEVVESKWLASSLPAPKTDHVFRLK